MKNKTTIIAVLVALIITLAGGYVFSQQSGPSKGEITDYKEAHAGNEEVAHTEHEEDGHGH